MPKPLDVRRDPDRAPVSPGPSDLTPPTVDEIDWGGQGPSDAEGARLRAAIGWEGDTITPETLPRELHARKMAVAMRVRDRMPPCPLRDTLDDIIREGTQPFRTVRRRR